MEDNKNINTQFKPVSKIMYMIVLPEESNAILEKENFIKDTVITKDYSNILEAFILNKNNAETIIIRPLDDPLHSTSLFGTEIAFFVTYMGIKLFQPDVVISMGYAGEVTLVEGEQPLGLGAVVIAKEKSIYHRRQMIVKYYEKTSEGHYPVLSCDRLVNELKFNSCLVGTSNSFVRHDDVAITKQVKVVEMELCSVARACHYFSIPCIGVKIISDGGAKDISEEERVKQFLDSLPFLRQTFYETYEKVNSHLFNKHVNEL
jgi:hypothetical protein